MGKSAMKVEPHVARRVRDATLKTTHDSLRALIDTMQDIDQGNPTPSKAVAKMSGLLYREATKLGIGIFRLMIARKRVKQNVALVGLWAEDDGTLMAVVSRVQGFPAPDSKPQYDIKVSRHALERVSERLGTIDTQTVRDELAAAIAGAAMTAATSDAQSVGAVDGRYYGKTPHGLACIVIEEGRATITTWISDDLARKDQLGGEWQGLKSGSGVSIETVNGSYACFLREQ